MQSRLVQTCYVVRDDLELVMLLPISVGIIGVHCAQQALRLPPKQKQTLSMLAPCH